MTDPPPGWRRRGLPSASASAVASAITHAPENAAYGLMALAPLGVAFGPVAMGLALLGAAVGSATASAAGAGRLVGDAGAALALLTGGLIAALLPHLPGAAADVAWQVLVLVALAIAAGGVLTALFGLLRLGGVVKFTPYPVRIGLSSGVGMLLIASAVPAALGQGFGASLGPGMAMLPGAALVSLCALGVSAAAAHLRARVPPVLLGLAAATLLHTALDHAGQGARLGPTVGVPQLPATWFNGAATSSAWVQALADPAVLVLLGSFALTVAVVVSLDTLLAASIVDGRLRRVRNADRELVAQGLANVASAAVGGLPASPALPASLGLVGREPQQRHIVAAYAGAVLAVLLLVPALLGVLPVSAVGGVLVFLGAEMLSPTLWRSPAELGGLVLRRKTMAGNPDAAWRRARPLAADWAVTAAVALCALLAGLAQAVLVGATFAVLLFVRANMRDVVRRVWTGDERHSLTTRPTEAAEVLRREGHRTVLLEIEGALFFGTADALRERLHRLAPQADTVILDLRQVSEIDVTAARILHEMAEDWEAMGKPLVFAEWPAHDPRRDVIEAVAAGPDAHRLLFADHVDIALEQAEDALLQRLQIDRRDGALLGLGETTIARGLSADELALLAAELTAHSFARGQVMFRAGDPGDALYISLRGDIALRMPGTTRRLASFAPGVTIGEMAVLAGTRRSAEAVAESDVSALGLSVASFERLTQQHPQLAAKLCRNIAVHLSERVRMLTGDLAVWVQRSDAVRPAPPPSPTMPP